MAVPLSSEDIYDGGYYESLCEGTRRSAATVVPILMELFRPQSVIDVGCGLGLWLAAFQEHGVSEVLGVDGAWVARNQRAVAVAARAQTTQPLAGQIAVVCLEVADAAGDSGTPLVETLTELAPVIVFSAAIPSQGGNGHVNERWPSYWSDLFARSGFGCLDLLRPRFSTRG